MNSSGDNVPALSAGIERRFRWHRSLVRRPRPSVGALALRSVRHARILGRPLSLRSAIGSSEPIGVRPGDRPVRPRGHPFLRLWLASQAGDGVDDSPSLLEAATTHAGRLPRVTARQQTPFAPGGGLARLRREVLPVRLMPDVAAVGTVVSDRERGRPRVATRSSPSRGAYRAPRIVATRRGGLEGSPQDGGGPETPSPVDHVTTDASSVASVEPSAHPLPGPGPKGSGPRNRRDVEVRSEAGPPGSTSQRASNGPDPRASSLTTGPVDAAPVALDRAVGRSAVGTLERIDGAGGVSMVNDPWFSEVGWGAVALILDGLEDRESYAALARRGSERAGERGPFWQHTSRFPRTEFRRGREHGAPPRRPLRQMRARAPWLYSHGAGDWSMDEGAPSTTASGSLPGGTRGARPSAPRELKGRGRRTGLGFEPDGVVADARRAAHAVRAGRGRRVAASGTARSRVPSVDGALQGGDDGTALERRGIRRALGPWPGVAARGRGGVRTPVGTLAVSGWITRGHVQPSLVPLAFGEVVLVARGSSWRWAPRPVGVRARSVEDAGRGTSPDAREHGAGAGSGVDQREVLSSARSQGAIRGERSTEPGETVQPLPAALEPLASALGVQGSVEVHSGPLTRRSLRALGTVAATVGRTIFVERPVDRSPAALSVVAHELVHVASGDTTGGPRLFNDPHLDDEELHARRVGSLVRAMVGDEAGVGEGASAVLAAVPPPKGSRPRRADALGPPLTASPVAPSDTSQARGNDAVLTDLHALYARSVAATSGERRGREGTPEAPATASASEDGGLVPRRDGSGPAVQTGGSRMIDEAGPVRPSSAPRAEEFLDWLVEQVERRLVRELDARGLRHRPDVL